MFLPLSNSTSPPVTLVSISPGFGNPALLPGVRRREPRRLILEDAPEVLQPGRPPLLRISRDFLHPRQQHSLGRWWRCYDRWTPRLCNAVVTFSCRPSKTSTWTATRRWRKRCRSSTSFSAPFSRSKCWSNGWGSAFGNISRTRGACWTSLLSSWVRAKALIGVILGQRWSVTKHLYFLGVLV